MLAPSSSRVLVLGVCIAIAGWTRSATASELELIVDLVQGKLAREGDKVTVSIVRENPDAIESDVAPLVVRAEPATETVVELEAEVHYRLRVDAEGFWAEERRLFLPPDGARAVLSMWPGGTLRGSLITAEAPPDQLAIHLQALDEGGRSDRLSEVTLSCPVTESTFRCSAPIGVFGGIVASDGYASIRLWRLEVERSEVLDLGPLQLLEGASIIGLAAATDDTPLPPTLEVELVAAAKGRGAKKSETLLHASPSAEGFFQFAGVPSGTYLVKVNHPGFVAVSSASFDIRDESELVLEEPLFVAPAATLELVVDPPMGPLDENWRFQLRQIGVPRSTAQNLSGTTSVSGYWKKEGLPLGDYELSLKGGFDSKWAIYPVVLEKGQPPVQINPEIVVLRGQVRVGADPISAAVTFSRGDDKSVKLSSGPDGTLEGYLPAGGPWLVDVRAEGTDYPQRTIDVRISETGLVARTDIELPDTRLEGFVLSQFGYRIPDAQVIIARKPEHVAFGQQPNEYEAREFGRFREQGPRLSAKELQRRQKKLGRPEKPELDSVTLKTDSNGEFVARGLLPGEIMARVQVPGAKETYWTHFKIIEGQTNRLPPLMVELSNEAGSGPPSF